MTLKTVSLLLLGFALLVQSQSEFPPVCEISCAIKIFDERCGGAVCPEINASVDLTRLSALCSEDCIRAVGAEDLTACLVDTNVWRPTIDDDVKKIEADIESFCNSEAIASRLAPEIDELDEANGFVASLPGEDQEEYTITKLGMF